MSGLEVRVVDDVVVVAEGLGPAGPQGPGVPLGGTTGQVLAKVSNTDNDTDWVDQSGGGGAAVLYTAQTLTAPQKTQGRSNIDAEQAGAAAAAVAGHAAGVDPHGDRAFATAAIATAIADLLNSTPGALDTLDELAAALGDDPNFAATIISALAGKLAKASNLGDLVDAAAALVNLGAGTAGGQVFTATTAAAIQTILELGSAALLPVGTTAGTVAAGDDARLSDPRTPTAHDQGSDTITSTLLDVTGTTHTAAAGDDGKVYRLTHASGCTVTIPDTLAAGWSVGWVQVGNAQSTFAGSGSMVVANRQTHTKTAGRYASGGLLVQATNSVYLLGDTGA